MKVSTVVKVGLFLLVVIVFGCAFAAPDTFVGIVNLFKQTGQAVQTVQTAQKIDEAKNNVSEAVENVLKPAPEKVVIQTATHEAVTIKVVPNQEQAAVVTATPEEQPTVVLAPTAKSQRRVVVRATIAPAPTEEPIATAVSVVEEPIAEAAVVENNQTTIDNSTTNNSTDLSVEAAGAIVLAPEKVQPQEAANSPEEKTHADKLAISRYTDSINMHWYAYDSVNNPDLTRESDYPVLKDDWCRVIEQRSFVDQDGHEMISYGGQSAIAHAVSLSSHGQASQLDVLVTFTAEKCQVNTDDATRTIKQLVIHP